MKPIVPALVCLALPPGRKKQKSEEKKPAAGTMPGTIERFEQSGEKSIHLNSVVLNTMVRIYQQLLVTNKFILYRKY
jgi:hypothetical protein